MMAFDQMITGILYKVRERFFKKGCYILCCLLLQAVVPLYAQNLTKIDSLQRLADHYSRSGQNYEAAWKQEYVDLLLLNAEPKIREHSIYLLAQAYIRSRQYGYAFYTITDLLERKTKSRNAIGIAQCYSVIAQVYLYKKDYQKAGYYNRKALVLFDKTPHKKGSVAVVKVLYANFLMEQGNYADALKFLKEALRETSGTGYYDSVAYIKDQMGVCYAMLNKGEQAEHYFLKALADNKTNPYLDIQMSIQCHLGKLYFTQKNFPLAISHLEEVLKLSPVGEKNEAFILASKCLSELYAEQGQYEQAYEYQMEVVNAKRNFMDTTMLTGTEALSTKFDAEQLSLQNKALQTAAETKRIEAEQADSRKSLYLFIIVFGAVVLGAALVFLYFYFRQKKAIITNGNNELKQKLLLTQMNPHFIFNSVDTIQSLIYDEKNAEAVDYLSKFSKLTLQILENSSHQHISLTEEIKMTTNYLVTQQLLYNHNFEFHIETDHAVDPEMFYIPPMLTQPFVENAVKHGLTNRKTGGMIDIRFYKKGRLLFFEVSDNGKGLKSQPKEGHRSMATKITSERLNTGKGFKRINIEVNTIMEDGEARGVVSRFAIPYEIKKAV